MSSMKLRRLSRAWLVFTSVSPRPVKPSSANVETPILLSSLVHISTLGAIPAEPCCRTTTGNRPELFASRSCPEVVVGFPLASPRKKCVSESVKVSIECSSVLAAISCETGSTCASCADSTAACLRSMRSSLKTHLGPGNRRPYLAEKWADVRPCRMSEMGQNAKYSQGADDFRFAPNFGHCSAAPFDD